MSQKTSDLSPSAVFFQSGRPGLGVLTLLMQVSLVFWPLARHMARQHQEQSGMQMLLSEFSEKYSLPIELRGRSAKRFRQTA